MERFRSAKTAETTETRENQPEKKIRGRPFAPGNPGRPQGSKNRTTKVLEQLIAGEAEKVTQKAIELALAGNATCLKQLFDRLLPRRNGRPLDFSLPAVNDMRDVVAGMAAVTTAVNDGTVTAEEAGRLVQILESYANALKTYDFASRIEALESKMKERS